MIILQVTEEELKELITKAVKEAHTEFLEQERQSDDELRMLTLREASKRLGISVNTLKKYIAAGYINRTPGGKIAMSEIKRFTKLGKE